MKSHASLPDGRRPWGGRSRIIGRAIGSLAAAAAWAVAGPAGAGVIPPDQEPPKPAAAIDVGALPRGVADVNQAVQSFEKRDFDACVRHLGKAVRANPELPPPHALLAKLALLNNQGAMVRPALDRAVAEDRDHPEIYVLFANLALAENRATDASVHLEKAAALAASKRWTADQRRRFERLCRQGDALVAEARGDWTAARSALASWLALEPANANARVRARLGLALFHLGRRDDAAKELQQAAKDDPALEPAALTLGWLYTRERDPKKAEEWVLRAVASAPESLRVRLGAASWFLVQGRDDEAKAQAEAAAKIDSASGQAKRILGLVARQKKELDRAEPIFQALAQESPGDAWLRNQLAMVLAEQGGEARNRRALELAELSVRQNPNAPEALITLGTVYYRINRTDDAIKVLQAVFNSGKASSDAVYVLARIQADRGRTEAARELARSALSAPGLFLARRDARLWLDGLATVKSPK